MTFLPECKIVLLSGQAATADLVRHAALKGHYFDVMAKPVHPTELLRDLSVLWWAGHRTDGNP